MREETRPTGGNQTSNDATVNARARVPFSFGRASAVARTVPILHGSQAAVDNTAGARMPLSTSRRPRHGVDACQFSQTERPIHSSLPQHLFISIQVSRTVRTSTYCNGLAFCMFAGLVLNAVQAALPAPSQLYVTLVSESSIKVTWTAVAGVEGYRLLVAPAYPGPYTNFQEYYAPPFLPAPNEATLNNLVEGDMYFMEIVSGTADGLFDGAASTVAVGIPSKSVRTGVLNILIEAYDETFCRILWEIPGQTAESGPAATHFAVAYRCGTALSSPATVHPQTFTSNAATIIAPFTMDETCQFYIISRNLNYNPADPWSKDSERAGKNKWSTVQTYTLDDQPRSVSGLKATAATLSSITLTFDLAVNAIAYQTSYAPISADGFVGDRLIAVTGVATREVTITGLTAQQLYQFRVQATNKHAKGYEVGSSIDVRVEANPAPPSLRIDSVQSTSITLSWAPPSSTQPLQYYVKHEQGGVLSPESTTTITAITLSSLQQGLPVTVFVRAKNLFGFGNYANISETPIETPVGVTSSVNVSLVPEASERSVQLSFMPVGFSTRFKVTISEAGGAFIDRGDVLAQTRGIITGLLANTIYSFKVFAGNKAGFNVLSRQSNSITTQSVAPPIDPVRNLRLLAVTLDSILLGWDAPPAENKVTHFRVEKSTSGTFGSALAPEAIVENQALATPGCSWPPTSTCTWAPSYNLTGLTLGREYYFAVTARTANAGGYVGVPRALLHTSTTSPPTLAVDALRVARIFPSSVVLSFSPLLGQSVTKYRIEWSTMSGNTSMFISAAEVEHPSSGVTVEFTVTGLKTTMQYTFAVTARNYNIEAYANVPSSTISGVRLMGLPKAPDNLRVIYLSSDTISLAWDKSSIPPVATLFRVVYRVGTAAFDAHGLPEVTATHITVTGLERGMLYDFKVFAASLAGYEVLGSLLVSAAPVARPTHVDALIITDIAVSSISLRWEPATFPRATSFLIVYLDKRIETTEFRHTATGLTPGLPVTFSIYARNFNSLGYETKGQTAVVTPIGPPALVSTLIVVGVTPSSVTVEYDAAQLVNVTKIKVQVKRINADNWTEYAVYQCRVDEQYLQSPPTCSTRILIDDLILGVLYSVRVLQRNSNAAGYLEGGNVLTISPTLKPTRSVNNLRVVGVTTSAVFLEFDKPLGVDSPTHYKIVYSLAAGGPEMITEEFPASEAILNATGLIKDVEYSFQIIGRNLNLAGYTNAVRSAVVTTAPFEKPSKVMQITNPGVGADEITISWEPPLRGPVSLYLIEIANATTLMNGLVIDLAELGLPPAYRLVGTTADTTFTVSSSQTIVMQVDVKLILRVSARNLNIQGYGDAAEILATPTAAPKHPPLDFKVESVTFESIFLSWMPPSGYVLGDDTIARYMLEGCAENCGSEAPFPAAPVLNAKWYIMGGSEYEWKGYTWKFTGNTFWRTIALLPYTRISFNVTRIGEYALKASNEYQFRVSAGNKNTLATGPISLLTEVMPLYPPGLARKVVISNPKITEFALNFVPPIVTNISSVADRYKIMIHDMVTGRKYQYHTVVGVTSLVVTDFNPGTQYYVTVHSGNLAGFDPIGQRSFSEITTKATPCTKDCCEQIKGCTKCCGLLARRIQNNAIELVWSAPPNLDLLQYKVKYQAYGLSATFVEAGIVRSNRILVSGLDFDQVADYKFLIIGGSRIKNTLDADTQAGEILVTSTQPVLLSVKLDISYVTATSVRLKWTRPYPQFSVYEIKYAIQVTLDSFDEDAYNNTRWVEGLADPDKGLYTTHEVTGLETDKYYVFRVVAKTPYSVAYKDGVYSNNIRTKPCLQPLPVQNLQISMVTLNLIKISWENKLYENTITHIKITWFGKRNNGTKEFAYGPTTHDFNISGLVSNEAYVFRLQARNWNLEGYETGITITGVPETTPPPPLNPRLVQYYSDGVELQWESNPRVPAARHYQIQCRVEEDPAADYQLRELANCVSGPASAGASFVAALQVESSSTFTLVQGIGQGYTYHFRICAVGSNYLGAIDSTCSDYLRVTPTGPPLPSSLAVASVTTSSITLSWTPNAQNSESWTFIPGKDQPLYDIACPGGSVDDLMAACITNGGCVGFSTTGCLKFSLGLETTWTSYSSTVSAKGECCSGVGTPAGCTAPNVDLSPKPACGCECKDCPSSCAEVTGLSLNTAYQFRLYTRDLHGLGYAGESSNLVVASPSAQPVTAVNDLRLVYTSENRAQLAWTGIVTESVTEYRVRASLDGVTWEPDPPLSVLDIATHQQGEVRGGAGLLRTGMQYWLKVEARNLNSLAYKGVAGSNIVTAIPFGVIGPVLDLRATESSVCTDIFCCPCCKANLCRGVGSITLTWKAPVGPVTSYRIEVAEVSKEGVVGSFAPKVTVGPPLQSTSILDTNVTGLLVGINYAFKVLAVSTSFIPYLPDCTRISPPDQVCPAVTFASPYPLPATSVESTLRVLAVTNGTIRVEWRPILSEPVTRYQVSYGTDILHPDAYSFAEVDQLNSTMTVSIGAINGPPEKSLTSGLLEQHQSYFVYVVPRNLNTKGYAFCPKSAENIAALDLGDGSFQLAWAAPGHTALIMSYRIWHKLNATNHVLSYAGRYDLLTPSSALEYTVNGLTAGESYSFYVIPSAPPCTMIGPIVTTNEPNKVRNFVPSKSSESFVEFSWSPSQSYDGHSLAQKFVLSSVERNFGLSCEVHNYTIHSSVSATKTSFVFSGLRTMQSYCFRIFAENYHELISGPASYYEAKAMGIPYAPPSSVSLVARNNVPGIQRGASVRLEWETPSIDRYVYPLAAEIRFYKVAYWKQTDTTCLQKLVHINCISYQEHPQTFPTSSGNITGLEPGTGYYFKVYSGNPSGYDNSGSEPFGIIMTSNLPGPVLNLEIPYSLQNPSVSASVVTLTWTMPTNPSPSKLKLAYREHATGRQVVEEQSCMPPASQCPSSKQWAGLTTAFAYTFFVYTGGPDDLLVPVNSHEAYTGVSSYVGGPYLATNSPRNLTLLSWSDTSIRIRFLEPEEDALNGPVLDYFVEGKIGAGAWTHTSLGVRLHPQNARLELNVESIGGMLLRFQEIYSFRVFTGNKFGNSTSIELSNITLHPRPSMVPTLERYVAPKIAQQSAPAFHLEWSTPLVGSNPGIGFEYVVEVSDNAGATFHQDLSSPFLLGSTQASIEFVNKPRPSKIQAGKVYWARIRPKNKNAGAVITSVAAKTKIVYTARAPGPVRSISVEYVTDSRAAVSWQGPYSHEQLSFSTDYDLFYDCEVAVYSLQPKFWALNGSFANMMGSGIAFGLQDLKAALLRAGANVAASDSRFQMRVIPRNSAGAATAKNPSTEIWFVGRPLGRVDKLSIIATRNGSVQISWLFPNTTTALVGFDIRTSSDGHRFYRTLLVPSTYKDENGLTQRSSSATVTDLKVGKNWIQVLQVSQSDVSIGYSILGPALIDSSSQSVTNLHAVSVTAHSALLRWDLSPSSLIAWHISYTTGDASLMLGPFSSTSPSYNVTGLDTGLTYTFFVSTRSASGIGKASTVTTTTMAPAPPVHSVQVLPFDAAGGLRMGWLVTNSNYSSNFRVQVAEEDRDGNMAAFQLVSLLSPSRLRSIPGLNQNQRYRFAVESANLHENGFGNPALLHYTVPAKPASPSQVRVTFSLDSGLIIQWMKATTGSTVTYFKIVTVAETSEEMVQYHHAATLMAEVQGLQPGSLHTITLSACNLAGCSAAPSLVDQRTAPSQPVEVKTASITKTSITLAWSHPSPTSFSYKYFVKYRRVTTVPQTTSVLDGRLVLMSGGGFTTSFDSWSTEAVSDEFGAGASATISGLTTNFKYQIALYAEYQSVRAVPVFIIGMPADAPQMVEEFKIADDAHDGVLSNSLTAMWKAPTGSTITHYDFFFWSAADANKRNYTRIGVFEANENADGSGYNFYTIRNLITFQRYGFEIIPRNLNSAGNANPLTMRDCSGLGDTLCTTRLPVPVHQPGRVQNLRMVGSTIDSVTLEWLPPPSGHSNFLKNMEYVVYYTTVVANSYVVVSTIQTTDGTTTPRGTAEITVANLQPAGSGVVYSFKVRARNGNSKGYGPDKILQGMPNAACQLTGCRVRNLEIAAYSGRTGQTGSVTISWSAPVEVDSNPYLSFLYKVYSNSVQLGPEIDGLRPYYYHSPIAIGESKTFEVFARTLVPGFGAQVAIVAMPKIQPSALLNPPELVAVTPTSVTLSWPPPASFSIEYAYKVGWRVAGTRDGFLNPSYSTSTSIVVSGLTHTQSYEFKVFARNLNADGFEGYGSPTLVASPRAALGPPPNFHIAEVNIDGSEVMISWQAHPGVTSARYVLTFGTARNDKNNITLVDAVDVFQATKGALVVGNIYHFSLRVKDLGGWSDVGYRFVRSISKASTVRSLAAFAIDVDDSGLSWDPPMQLGSPSEGLSIWGYRIDVRVGASSWMQLGTTDTLRFNHHNITQKGVTYTYRVAVLVKQAPEFGDLLNVGAYTQVNLFFGTAPTFVGQTPPDKQSFIALQSGIVYIPLQAYSPDVAPSQLTFRCTGALPSVVTLSPSVPTTNMTSQTAMQNLAIQFLPDLAGSEFFLCMQAQDSNGLRTAARCYTILLPLATPVWLAPPHNSEYEARVGCTLTVAFVVEDRTSSNIDPAFAAKGGFIPEVVLLTMTTESDYKSTSTQMLPNSALLVAPSTSALNPATNNLVWKMRKGQEGFSYRLCFATASAANAENQLCISVKTVRCQYCLRPEDSLQRIAKEWHTTWTEVWSGNHPLRNPDLLMTEQIVQVGPIYEVQKDEDLEHIALRYGVELQDLLLWNPDVADSAAQQQHYIIHELQQLCLVPQSCIYSSGISSSPTVSHAAL